MSQAGKIICIFGTKGGVGRTTVAANLAIALGRRRNTVVLADFDVQSGVAAEVVGAGPEKTIGDLIDEGDYDRAADYTSKYNRHVSLLAAPARPAISCVLQTAGVARTLEALRSHFDYLVIDLPGSFSDYVCKTLEKADLIGLVAVNEFLSLRNAMFALQNLAMLGYELQNVRLIINRYDPRGLTDAEVARAVGVRVFWRIDEDKKVPAALKKMEPVVTRYPRSKASRSITGLAARLPSELGKAGK